MIRTTMAAASTMLNCQCVTAGRVSRASRESSLLRRLLIGNDPIAAGGRIRQRPPPDSLSLPEIL